MTLAAGNTVTSLKPKEVTATVCIDCGVPTTPGTGSARCPQCWQDRVNSPDVDECAPIIAEHVNENFQLPEKVWIYAPQLEKAAKDLNRGLVNGLRECLNKEPLSEKEHSDLYETANEPEAIPATNIWSLRWRINKLEEQMDDLLHRLAQFNIRSGQKL